MDSREVPGKVRELIDQLGRAFVDAIMADEAGHGLLQQIQESGFEVGIMLEATVALHPKPEDDCQENTSRDGCHFFDGSLRMPEPHMVKDFEWSEEDKALMCNFRISLD
jgi:hypothetical protein